MPILDITFFRPLPIALTKFLHAFWSPPRRVGAGAAASDRLEREIGVHRFRAVAAEQREMVHFARGAGLDDEARCWCAAPCPTRCWWIAESASSAGIATLFAIAPAGRR